MVLPGLRTVTYWSKSGRVLPSAKYQLVLGAVAPTASEPPVQTPL